MPVKSLHWFYDPFHIHLLISYSLDWLCTRSSVWSANLDLTFYRLCPYHKLLSQRRFCSKIKFSCRPYSKPIESPAIVSSPWCARMGSVLWTERHTHEFYDTILFIIKDFPHNQRIIYGNEFSYYTQFLTYHIICVVLF